MNFEQRKKWYINNDLLFFASIELTQKCNFNCLHCYCSDKRNPYIPYEDVRKIIDKLYESGCFLLIFTGGEILTYDFFSEIYVYAKRKGFMIDLMTNASLIDKNLIPLLKQYPPHNISVTVYGTNEMDYNLFTGNGNNYNKVMNALILLKESKLNFNIRTVATKTLYNSIKNGHFDRMADSLGVPFRYDPVIFPKTSGDSTPLNECLSPKAIVKLEQQNNLRSKKWKELIQRTDNVKWKCRAGINSLAIDYKGEAYVCGLYRKKGISILNRNIDDVLEHLKKVHKEHEQIVYNSECSNCASRKICKWCPAYSNVYNGTENQKVVFFCELAEKRRLCFGKS